MDGDLMRRMARCLTDQTVEMVIEANVMERHSVEAGMAQGLPVSVILFAIYTSGLIRWVEETMWGAEGLCFVDDIGMVATGNDFNQVVKNLVAWARASIDCGKRRELEFDTAKTNAALFTHRRGHKKHLTPKLTAKTRVENGFVRFTKKETRWLGVWMETQPTFKNHHN